MSLAFVARSSGEPTPDLAVTYHYIRPRNSDGVTGITPAEFDAQLSAIARTHRFVAVDEFVSTRSAASSQDGRPICLITFDDAVRDQYDFALPVLERHGVQGVFFAPMRPFDNALDDLDRWTPQHLVHALAQHLGWSDLESRVRAALGHVKVDSARMNSLYHYEVPEKRWLKYALAFAVPAEKSARILNEINRIGPRLRASDWFMSAEQLSDLQRRGHALGAHGYDHLPYSTLTPIEQAWDMARAAGLMDTLFGHRSRALAYPFGRSDAATHELVRRFGYTHAFTTDERTDCKFLDSALASLKPAEKAA